MKSSIEHITVSTFFKENKDRLKLSLQSSENGFNRKITMSDAHRPGLALAGFVELFTYNRVQVLGNTEMRYLKSLTVEKQNESIDRLIEFEIPLILVTNDNKVPKHLIQVATRRSITVLSTPLTTTTLIHLMSDYLDLKFAPIESVHGSLVDVYGVGLLVTGRSGLGKSEVALDLVERGHRLVADDVVIITRTAEDILIGKGREISEHHLEVRGVGLVDVKKVFGIRGVRLQKRIEVEIRLHRWDDQESWERTGLDEVKTKILDVEIPLVDLPINPGKNMTVICETIAMNELLKIQGYHTAREFNRRLKEHMRAKKSEKTTSTDTYLRRDVE
jgi:HPr kinase/phosphorylase